MSNPTMYIDRDSCEGIEVELEFNVIPGSRASREFGQPMEPESPCEIEITLAVVVNDTWNDQGTAITYAKGSVVELTKTETEKAADVVDEYLLQKKSDFEESLND